MDVITRLKLSYYEEKKKNISCLLTSVSVLSCGVPRYGVQTPHEEELGTFIIQIAPFFHRLILSLI